jgi:hypothetical protein
VHNSEIDEVFFVQKFIDGLNYKISNTIALHRPRTVDAALSLALMQEEVLEVASRRFTPRPREAGRYSAKAAPAATLQAPGVLGSTPTSPNATDKSEVRPKWDNKVAALRAARRAKGLCMKCGEPYSPQHRCPKQVPLHVLDELWELVQDEGSDGDNSDTSGHDSEAELLQLSYYAAEGIQGHKTMRLQGLVQDQALLILIDSGSSSTFISSVMVAKLQLPTTAITPVHVTIADGTSMTCDTMVQQLKWWVQGHTFTSDARVLQLKGYDMILGADWLAAHSPMYIHWQKKKMRFTHQGARITLRLPLAAS